MIPFTEGQKVRRLEDTTWPDDETSLYAGEIYTVSAVVGLSGMELEESVPGFSYDTVRFEPVAEWEVELLHPGTTSLATPAALDPSKVKEGDTVTITRKGATVTDTVFDVPLRNVLDLLHFEGRFTIGANNWDLTAHQPAPEPEPGPGYYTVNPVSYPGSTWSGIVFEDGSFVGEEDGFYRSASRGEFTVSSRLVVIDPADINLIALGEVYKANAVFDRWDRGALGAVLAHLGLTKEEK